MLGVCLPCHAHSSCGQCNRLSPCNVSCTPGISTPCCSHCLGNWAGLPHHCLPPLPRFLFPLLPLLSLLRPSHLALVFSKWRLHSRLRQEMRHWAEPLLCLTGLYEQSVWERSGVSRWVLGCEHQLTNDSECVCVCVPGIELCTR